MGTLPDRPYTILCRGFFMEIKMASKKQFDVKIVSKGLKELLKGIDTATEGLGKVKQASTGLNKSINTLVKKADPLATAMERVNAVAKQMNNTLYGRGAAARTDNMKAYARGVNSLANAIEKIKLAVKGLDKTTMDKFDLMAQKLKGVTNTSNLSGDSLKGLRGVMVNINNTLDKVSVALEDLGGALRRNAMDAAYAEETVGGFGHEAEAADMQMRMAAKRADQFSESIEKITMNTRMASNSLKSINMTGESTRETLVDISMATERSADGADEFNVELRELAANLKKVKKQGDGVLDFGGKYSKGTRVLSNDVRRLNKGARSSAKAFSQLAFQSNTLVLAYAAVAVNVIALTETFRILNEAANFDRLLEQTSSFTAAVSGLNVSRLAQEMNEFAGGILSVKESMEFATKGAAFGFTADELGRLSLGARKASIALGRDFSDSMDRVIRGISKQEIELFDELGIVTRLEPAFNKLAVAMNKSTSELTDAERKLALTNEVLRQLETRFSGVGVAATGFEKLSKATKDFVDNSLMSLASALDPVASTLASLLENFSEDTRIRDANDSLMTYKDALTALGSGADSTGDRIDSYIKKLAIAANAQLEVAKSAREVSGAMGEIDFDRSTFLGSMTTTALGLSAAWLGVAAAFKVVSRNSVVLTGFLTGLFNKQKAMTLDNSINIFNKDAKKGVNDMAMAFNSANTRGRALNTTIKTIGKSLGRLLIPAAIPIALASIITGLHRMGQASEEAVEKLRELEKVKVFLDNATDEAFGTTLTKELAKDEALAEFNARQVELIREGMLEDIENMEKQVRERLIKYAREVQVASVQAANLGVGGLARGAATTSFGAFGSEERATAFNQFTDEIRQTIKKLKSELQDDPLLSKKGVVNTGKALERASEGITNAKNSILAMSDGTESAKTSVSALIKEITNLNSTTLDASGAGENLLTLASNKAFEELRDKFKFSSEIKSTEDLSKRVRELQQAELALAQNRERVQSGNALLGNLPSVQLAEQLTLTKDLLQKSRALSLLTVDQQKALEDQIVSQEYALALAEKKETLDKANLQTNREYALATEFTRNMQLDRDKLLEAELFLKVQLLKNERDLKETGSQRKMLIDEEINQLNELYNLKVENAKQELAVQKKLADIDNKKSLFSAMAASKNMANSKIIQKNFEFEKASILARMQGLSVHGQAFTILNEQLSTLEKATKLEVDRARAAEQYAIALAEANYTRSQDNMEQDNIAFFRQETESLGIKLSGGNEFERSEKVRALQNQLAELKFKRDNDPALEGDTGKAALTALNQQIEETENAIGNLDSKFVQGAASVRDMVDAFKDLNSSLSGLGLSGLQTQFAGTIGTLNTSFETLKLHSTEGGTLSALSSGFKGLGEVITSEAGASSDEAQAQAKATVTALTSIGQMGLSLFNEISQGKSQAIDMEIAAEQKRDGKSAESVKKIEALQTKKIKLQEKSAIANIGMSTAMGIMQIWASPELDPITKGIMSAGVGLLGMVQINNARKSAQGQIAALGSAGGSNKMSITSGGQRDNTVNVNRAASAGELAYLRGGSGMGTANNFNAMPGRMGGGSVMAGQSVMVGEAGPELITPTVPVEVTPSGESSQAANVTISPVYNISTVDSNGFAELTERFSKELFDGLEVELNARNTSLNNL